MYASPLSNEAERRIALLFPPQQQEHVRQLLRDECGNNLPFLQTLDGSRLDRYRFAVLKLSDGDMDKLAKAIVLAKQDWRDLLMAAEFGHNIHAHEEWLPTKHW